MRVHVFDPSYRGSYWTALCVVCGGRRTDSRHDRRSDLRPLIAQARIKHHNQAEQARTERQVRAA